MPLPVIQNTTSVLSIRRGEPFAYQPAATNDPTDWAAVGLPPGMSINEETGLISGTPTLKGVYLVTLKAHNADGWSAEFFLPVGVSTFAYSLDASVDLNMSLLTGVVRNPGISDAAAPVLYAKAGDTEIIALGLEKENVFYELAVVSIALGLKEFESEKVHIISDGNCIVKGALDDTRYQFHVEFARDKLKSVLSSYAGRNNDREAFFNAIAEIRIVYQVASLTAPEETLLIEKRSQNFPIKISRNLLPVVP